MSRLFRQLLLQLVFSKFGAVAWVPLDPRPLFESRVMGEPTLFTLQRRFALVVCGIRRPPTVPEVTTGDV